VLDLGVPNVCTIISSIRRMVPESLLMSRADAQTSPPIIVRSVGAHGPAFASRHVKRRTEQKLGDESGPCRNAEGFADRPKGGRNHRRGLLRRDCQAPC